MVFEGIRDMSAMELVLGDGGELIVRTEGSEYSLSSRLKVNFGEPNTTSRAVSAALEEALVIELQRGFDDAYDIAFGCLDDSNAILHNLRTAVVNEMTKSVNNAVLSVLDRRNVVSFDILPL